MFISLAGHRASGPRVAGLPARARPAMYFHYTPCISMTTRTNNKWQRIHKDKIQMVKNPQMVKDPAMYFHYTPCISITTRTNKQTVKDPRHHG